MAKMVGEISKLKDLNGKYMFPVTTTEAILTPDGVKIEDKIKGINNMVDDITQKTTVNIYVSTNGSDENKGVDASTPFQTLQRAFNYISENSSRGFVVSWIVNIASGIYTETNCVFNTPTTERVVIKGEDVGGHPNVPSVVFDGSGKGDYVHGIRIGGIGVKVLIKDIKFINFTSNRTRIGLVGESESDLITDNIHADNCDWCGIYAFNTIRARIQGGKINACRSGFVANATQTTIGYPNKPVIITNSTESGIYWSRGSQGHADYCVLDRNAVGLIVAENSRVDTVALDIKNNTVGIRTMTGGVYGEGGAPNVFTGNTTNIEYKAFSGDTTELKSSMSPVLIAYDRMGKSVVGVGTHEISKPYTVKANRLSGVGTGLKIEVFGTGKLSAGSKIDIKIGGMTLALGVTGAQASNSVIMAEANVFDVAGGYRGYGKLEANMLYTRTVFGSGFVGTSDQEISISATLTGTDDALSIQRVNVYLIG